MAIIFRLLLLFFSTQLVANEPSAEEMQEFYKSLRCLVCDGQSVYESNSEFSEDIEQKTNDLLAQGKTLEEIKGYLVSAYGAELIIGENSKIWPLWLVPFFLLAFLFFKIIFRKDG